jgi:Protein of unknown function (DUF3421)
VFVENFEVLAAKENKFTWEPASDGKIATGAVSTGKEGNDEFYIGRAPYQGSMTVGKVRAKGKYFFINFKFQINFRFILLTVAYTLHSMAMK